MNKILKCLLSVFMVISLAFSSLAALVALSPSVASAADSSRSISISSWNISSGYSVSFANTDRVAVARAENVRNTAFALYNANPDGSLGSRISSVQTFYDVNTEGTSSLVLSGDKTSGWFDVSNLADGSYALIGEPSRSPVVSITFTISTSSSDGIPDIGTGIFTGYICPVCGDTSITVFTPQGTPDDIQTYDYFNSIVSPVASTDPNVSGYRLCESCFNNFKNESVSAAPYEKTNEIVSTTQDAVVRCSSCNLPVPSSADLDENGKCLHCTSSNFVYRTYRLFDCLVDEKDYSAQNIEYSSPEMAAVLKDYCEYAQDAAEKIKENIKNNDELVSGSYGMDLARKVANSDITPISISEFGGSNTFDKEGYYLILTMDSKGGVASVASLPIFRLIGEDQLTITSKTALPTLKKEYISNGVSGSSVAAGLGDTVRVRLTGTLPDNFASYAVYEYRITDEISYLTPIENSVSIKLNGTVDITNEFRIEPVPDIIYRFTAEHLEGIAAVNTDIITIEYDAVLSSLPEAASVGDPVRGFSNAAELTYSNNPLSIGSTGTLSASAFVRSYALDLLKIDNATSAPLANVGFTVKKSVSVLDEYNVEEPKFMAALGAGGFPVDVAQCDSCSSSYTSGVPLPCGFTTGEGADGCPYCGSIEKYLTRTDDGLFSFADDPYIFSTDEDGHISLVGLGAASYTIDEVLPANDYRPLAGSIGFNLEYSSVEGGFSATANCPELVSVDDGGSLITVKNMKVLSLPITGSTGAVICTVLGVGCLIVSLVLYLRKRAQRKLLE